jgi:glycine/D-amino acid oxidase-like deaminating enzyme/nitrite reductase/ring-hydroxylating ferredoxin subunit
MEDRAMPAYPSLTKEAEADVCIIGAGISGLTTAYLLAREKKKVIVLESGILCRGETSRTTAHLAFALDDRFTKLENIHGEEGARKAAQSHMAAIDTIERIIAELGIDADFTRLDGYLFAPPHGNKQELQEELEAAKRAGIEDVTFVEKAPIPNFDTERCLRFPRQGQFHPLKYLTGVAKGIAAHGGEIYEHSHASDIEDGEMVTVRTRGGGVVHAKNLVIATNAPVHDSFAVYTKQAPYRTYVVAFEIPKGSVPEALYWDTVDPYHYVRIQSQDEKTDLLIVGGEDHKTGQSEDMEQRYRQLEEWTAKRFPVGEKAAMRWSGQVMETVDGLAMIGHNPLDKANVYIATGDSGHGMTHGTIAGMILSDLILGRENPWADLYSPGRMRVSGETLKEFTEENANVAKQYIEDHLTNHAVTSADDIKPGQGGIVLHDGKKIALFRDEAGKQHRKSAVCPHLGCIVHWNPGEQSWDCPCHGSRYDATGEVLNGPTIAPLGEVDE